MRKGIQNGLLLLLITVVFAVSISGFVSAKAVNGQYQDKCISGQFSHETPNINYYCHSMDQKYKSCKTVCSDGKTCENNCDKTKTRCVEQKCVPPKVKCPKCTSTIGDRVWNDSNSNGIQDPDEKGVANVTVNLWKGNATDPVEIIATTKTDENGIYYFNNLVAGIYWLEFKLPEVAGGTWKFSPQNQGTDDSVDSDPNASGIAGPIILGWCICDPSWDAGLIFTPAAAGGGEEFPPAAGGGEFPAAAGGEELLAAAGGPTVAAAEVTMQETGFPIGMLLMAILAVITGLAIPKIK